VRQKSLGGLVFALICGLAAGAQAQDATAGQAVFKSQCGACHSPVKGRNVVGPSLFGVVGRHSGIIPNFHYSGANKASGLVWDTATLDRYLADPSGVVPGTFMTYPGLEDARKRSDVIAYLSTLQ
jgi:cytochrome c